MNNLRLIIKRFLREESGIALVYTALIMVPILAVAGFAIDSGYVSYIKTRLQNATDAAALAAASNAPSRVTSLTSAELNTIINAGQAYATTNMPQNLYGDVLTATEITAGYWDSEGTVGAANTFHPLLTGHVSGSIHNHDISDHSHDGLTFNAVQVTTSLTNSKSNAASLNLIRLLGYNQMELAASAIVTIVEMPHMQCLDNGFVALGTMASNGNNIITGSAACFYGRDGVKLASNSCFGEDPNSDKGVFFGMPDPEAAYGSGGIHYGNNNVIAPTSDCLNGLLVGDGIETSFNQVDINTSIANPDEFIFDLSLPSGDPAHSLAIASLMAEFQADTSVFPTGLNTPESHTVAPPASIELGDLVNSIVFVDGNVSFPEGVSIINSYIMATGDIAVPANAQLGTPSQCDQHSDLDDSNQVFLMAGGDVQFASNPSLYATQVVAGQDINFTANGGSAGGISFISGGDIKFTSNWNIDSCPENDHFLEFDQDDDRRTAGRAILVQ